MTECECEKPGWCERHQVKKNEAWWKSCQTREDYFELWEKGHGPGQPRAGKKVRPERRPKIPSVGVGAELCQMIGWLPERTQGCGNRDDLVKMLNRRGIEWCSENVAQVTELLQTEASKHKATISDNAAATLIRKACEKATAKQVATTG